MTDNAKRDTAPIVRQIVQDGTVAHVLMIDSEATILCRECATHYIRPARLTEDDLNAIILATGRGQTCERCQKEIR
jgi:hypothetical protein